jgi:phosphate transport system permease protein
VTERRYRAFKNVGFVVLCATATSVSVIALAVLLTAIALKGTSHLVGGDWEAAAADRQPQPPDSFVDLRRVDWARTATELDEPSLAGLVDVDWAQLGRAQGLEYADEIAALDWTALAGEQSVGRASELAEIDWPVTFERLRVPGKGRLAALLGRSNFGQFVTSPPSRRPERAGIGPALLGTIWICLVCALVALPLGAGTAIFLEEYKPKHRLLRALRGFIQLNITNLAGVPSIVYGIIGLTAFVQMFGVFGNPNDPLITIGTREDWYHAQIPFGRGVLAGGLTLMLVILPIVIISAQEALRAVPGSYRHAALALGSTRWQMIRRMTLPAALPGIMTGSILAMSRAIGEAAPVLIICGIVFIRFTPHHLMDEFTAMPLQIYDWAGRPQEPFHAVAASGIIVLLAALLAFNAVAIVIRQKFQRNVR